MVVVKGSRAGPVRFVPAHHLIVGLNDGSESRGIESGAFFDAAVNGFTEEAMRQPIVGRGRAFPIAANSHQLVAPLAPAHQFVNPFPYVEDQCCYQSVEGL